MNWLYMLMPMHHHRNKLWDATPLTKAKTRTPEKCEFLGYSVSTPSSLRYRPFPCRCSGCVDNLWEYRVPVGDCLNEKFLTRQGTQTKLETVVPRSVAGDHFYWLIYLFYLSLFTCCWRCSWECKITGTTSEEEKRASGRHRKAINSINWNKVSCTCYDRYRSDNDRGLACSCSNQHTVVQFGSSSS